MAYSQWTPICHEHLSVTHMFGVTHGFRVWVLQRRQTTVIPPPGLSTPAVSSLRDKTPHRQTSSEAYTDQQFGRYLCDADRETRSCPVFVVQRSFLGLILRCPVNSCSASGIRSNWCDKRVCRCCGIRLGQRDSERWGCPSCSYVRNLPGNLSSSACGNARMYAVERHRAEWWSFEKANP